MPDDSLYRNVRMRGFGERVPVASVLAWIAAHAKPLSAETVSLEAAFDRVLAADVSAAIDLPSFDRAAMDGFALRSAETVGASLYNPVYFRVAGECSSTQPFEDKLPLGSAVRIVTGAPLPAGADAVVPAEYAEPSGEQIVVTATFAAAEHVVGKGVDVKQGAPLLSAGCRLGARHLGLFAAAGVEQVEVVRRPQVRMVAVGSELAAPGAERGPCQVFDANSVMLERLVSRDGGEVIEIRRVADDLDVIREMLSTAGVDVVLVAGGCGVGFDDEAARALGEVGELAIHGVALHPGGGAAVGRTDLALVFLLPGNPAACLCAYDFFAGRALRQLAGRRADWPYARRSMLTARKITSRIGEIEFCPVRIVEDHVEPLPGSAAVFSAAARADGFVIVPEASEGFAAGSTVTVYLYD